MKIALVLPPLPAPAPALARLWEAAQPAAAPGDEFTLWLPGYGPEAAAALPLPEEVTSLYCAGQELGTAYLPEPCLAWLPPLMQEQAPGLVLFYGSVAGQELAARLAARLALPCFAEAQRLWREGGALWAEKKALSSHLDWRQPLAAPAVASVARGRAASEYTPAATPPAPIVCSAEEDPAPAYLLGRRQLAPAAQNPLEAADFVLAGGRGLGNRAGHQLFAETAAALGATAGLTRPAALNGWGTLEEIVGQSGIRIAPQLCIAVGASGAAAFVAGVARAKTLVAVNTDENAPIFAQADIGIIADAAEFLTALKDLAAADNPTGGTP